MIMQQRQLHLILLVIIRVMRRVHLLMLLGLSWLLVRSGWRPRIIIRRFPMGQLRILRWFISWLIQFMRSRQSIICLIIKRFLMGHFSRLIRVIQLILRILRSILKCPWRILLEQQRKLLASWLQFQLGRQQIVRIRFGIKWLIVRLLKRIG